MGTVLLVRHGRTAQTGPVLTGWTPGVHLDDAGRQQARDLAARLAGVPLTAVVSSPLERCRETAAALVAGRTLRVKVDKRLGECGYGDWTGRQISALVKDPLWKVVQAQPSAVTFPGGESMRDMQARAVAAVRERDRTLGPETIWVACSHGDVIKAVLADALGLHLDQFQRLHVEPASVSVIRYTELRPFVLRTNDVGGTFTDLLPAPRKRGRRKPSSDAVVGGGSGAPGT